MCTACNTQTLKWFGCCPSCGAWNTAEEVASSFVQAKKPMNGVVPQLRVLSQVPRRSVERVVSGIEEWDRVLGGGLMPGSFLILTGDPGIGKSTLLLRVAHALSQRVSVVYVSTEESLEQVSLRAVRTGCLGDSLQFSDQADLEVCIAQALALKPAVLIIDSIQNCFSQSIQASIGSMGYLRDAAFKLMRLAKDHNIAVLVSGHITKDGTMAGPKLLEHMVDGVFYLQCEDRWQTRILRSVKNRFGTVDELGFFQMSEAGLVEVSNVTTHLLDEISAAPGSALVSYVEGSRPLILELQALVVASQYGMPQRVISGIDPKQVVLIAAILEKYLKIKLSAHDLFFKTSGGIKIAGSSSDLGIALALLSSYFQSPLSRKSLAVGEISLTGQIKPINFIGFHIGEAEKIGVERVIVSESQRIDKASVELVRLKTVAELLSLFE